MKKRYHAGAVEGITWIHSCVSPPSTSTGRFTFERLLLLFLSAISPLVNVRPFAFPLDLRCWSVLPGPAGAKTRGLPVLVQIPLVLL